MDRLIKFCLLAAIFAAMCTNIQAAPAIRMLILKHSREYIAESDANLAITAVKNAKAAGLKIQIIGNHFVDGQMMFHYVTTSTSVQEILEQNIKDNAVRGDTLIVFTIGHGFESGHLDNLGQREKVMRIIAEAAGRHRQKILWWQLSCHACAKLPEISSLSKTQQQYFSMIASSAANDVSAVGVQGRIMEKVFIALANKNPELDPDGKGVVTNARLGSFLNRITSGLGSRVYSANREFKIFGKQTVPKLPIIDRNNKQGEYDEEYILLPD